MNTPLDRPVWQSLTGYHADMALGDDVARRFLPDVNVFASAVDDTPQAMAHLATMIGSGEEICILQAPPINLPAGFTPLKQAMGVQMVYERAELDPYRRDDIEPLGDADAPEMIALAHLTEPGPFLPRTHAMGRFFGVRIDGRLAAMAGERMRFDGYTEVSGVCTHPDFRGQGLAGALSAYVAGHILARGDTPFLHAWASNTGAIRLYEKLGFKLRSDIHAAIVRRD